METPPPIPAPVRPFRVWPYLLLNALAAVWIDFTQFHRLQTSDSVVFVLASLYEMRVFFWEQDRVGMLVPLLNSWCHSPFHNLLLQTGAMVFIGLSMPVMLARILTPQRMAPLAITVANAAFLLLAPDKLQENWLLVCNYPSALLMGYFACTLIDDRPVGETWARRTLRVLGCAALLLIAHWQYFGVLLYLGPLLAFRAWAKGGPGAPMARHGWWRTLFRPLFDLRCLTAAPLIWAALGLVVLLMLAVRERNPIIVGTPHEGSPSEKWLETWEKLIAATAELPKMDDYALAFGGLCAAGFVLSLAFRRRALGPILWATVPALLAATLEFAFLGTREWMANNEYHPRYLVAITTTAIVAFALIGLVPLLSLIPRRREPLAILVGGVLLLAGASARNGLPSHAGVRALLDEKCGTLTPLLLESKCEAVGGEYWVVWMSMFHVNMTLHERGEYRVVIGLGHRCEPMRGRWSQYPGGFRIALPDDDLGSVESPAELRGLAAPFEFLEERDTLTFPPHPHAPARRLIVSIYRTRPQAE